MQCPTEQLLRAGTSIDTGVNACTGVAVTGLLSIKVKLSKQETAHPYAENISNIKEDVVKREGPTSTKETSLGYNRNSSQL